MAKVNVNDYGTGELRPKLTPAVLRNAENPVLTVTAARTGIKTGDGRKAALLIFEEHPDYDYWLNRTGIAALVERLGGDDEDWVGHRIPLVRVEASNPTTGANVLTYHVASVGQWDELLMSGPDAAARP